jgi:EAL domain-containing protein (putative c-di-GMP-specific phosphodiesterase class I)
MIGEWVVQQACRQFEQWQNDVAALSIAVNLSARQFRHPDFIRMMEECLHHYAIDPALIELEITESLLMNDIENSIKTMHQLKALGFKLSIDDFGTGYSSLSYLKDFPIDKLKIDRAFVMNIETNPEDRTLVKTIVDLAHNLNLTVVAEGVEDAQQLAILQQLGVEEIQGFYFSKPLPAEDISQRYLAR